MGEEFKHILIEREVECIGDCLILAGTALDIGNIGKTKEMILDALKSIEEIERLNTNETVVLVGTVSDGRHVDS